MYSKFASAGKHAPVWLTILREDNFYYHIDKHWLKLCNYIIKENFIFVGILITNNNNYIHMKLLGSLKLFSFLSENYLEALNNLINE